MGALIYKI